MSARRIVVTGMGAITPIGEGLEDFWTALIAGKSGIRRITYFDPATYPVKVDAEVPDFDPGRYMEPKMADRTSRFTQLAVASAKMAVAQAALDMTAVTPEKVGVCVGNTLDITGLLQDYDRLVARGPKRINPLFIARVSPHVAAVHLGLLFGAKGPNSNVDTACASGAEALATAYDTIKLGYADVMIAGGAEATINQLTLAALWIVGALTVEEDPAKASRPFCLERSGFVFGEGSGMMVLEELEHARRREAPILAEIAGVGRSFDAYDASAPNYAVEAVAMKNALDAAGVAPQEVDYINAHGTGTKLNDASETRAIKEVFGPGAYSIPVSSNKSMTGHAITAAGAIEAIASVLTINRGVIPPTINYLTPDPECDLDYVPNEARPAEVNVCLSNSFGMGGQNCCLILKKFEG